MIKRYNQKSEWYYEIMMLALILFLYYNKELSHGNLDNYHVMVVIVIIILILMTLFHYIWRRKHKNDYLEVSDEGITIVDADDKKEIPWREVQSYYVGTEGWGRDARDFLKIKRIGQDYEPFCINNYRGCSVKKLKMTLAEACQNIHAHGIESVNIPVYDVEMDNEESRKRKRIIVFGIIFGITIVIAWVAIARYCNIGIAV